MFFGKLFICLCFLYKYVFYKMSVHFYEHIKYLFLIKGAEDIIVNSVKILQNYI